MQYEKVFIKVIAAFTPEGKILPLSIVWSDHQQFEIDRVLDIRPKAAMKVGGAGVRYTCRIQGQERYLFLEENRWFVEKAVL